MERLRSESDFCRYAFTFTGRERSEELFVDTFFPAALLNPRDQRRCEKVGSENFEKAKYAN